MTRQEPLEAALAASSENSNKRLMNQVRAGDGTQAIDTKQLFQPPVKDTLEAFLELSPEAGNGFHFVVSLRARSRLLWPLHGATNGSRWRSKFLDQ